LGFFLPTGRVMIAPGNLWTMGATKAA